MPDGSVHASLASLQLEPSCYERARRIAELDHAISRAEDLDADRETLNTAYDEILDEYNQLLATTPKSIEDAASLLLHASGALRDALYVSDEVSMVADGWLALGRVLRFLVDQANVGLLEIGGTYTTLTPINGFDPAFAANLWMQRVLEADGQILWSKGHLGVHFPQKERPQKTEALIAEMASIDVTCVGSRLSTVLWNCREYDKDPVSAATMDLNNWAFVYRPNIDGTGTIHPIHLAAGGIVRALKGAAA